MDEIIRHWRNSSLPHPSTIVHAESSQFQPDCLIDIINYYHAYCKPCRFHMYTQSEITDHCSNYLIHLNSAKHKVNSRDYPRNLKLFNGNKCNACQDFVYSNPVRTRTSLMDQVKQHVTGGEHRSHARRYLDKTTTVLSALVHQPKLKELVCKSYCKICNSTIWNDLDGHIDSYHHAESVRKHLYLHCGFELSSSFVDERKLYKLWLNLGGSRLLMNDVALNSATKSSVTVDTSAKCGKIKMDKLPHKDSATKCVPTKGPATVQNCTKKGTKPKKRKIITILSHSGINITAEKKRAYFCCEVCSIYDKFSQLSKHLDECLVPHGQLDNILSEDCKICNITVIYRGISKHVKSPFHMENERQFFANLAKIKEEKKESLSREQASNLIRVKVLNAEGLPQDIDNLFDRVHSLFKSFGVINNIRINRAAGTASIRYWQQSVIAGVLKNHSTIQLGEHVLTLSEKELEISGKDSKVNVTLADEIVNYLTNHEKLEARCWELADAAHRIQHDEQEIHRLDHFMSDLSKILYSSKWDVYLFGSRATGLALGNDCDVDVFAGSEDMFMGRELQDVKDQRAAVVWAARSLRKSKIYSNVFGIIHARVPIVKFRHIPTNLNCDLSFRNGLSTFNGKFQWLMIQLDNRVCPMVMFLKEWIRFNEFKDLLTSYAASIMLFVYLAQLDVPVLPTLKSLRSSQIEPRVIDGWDTSFDSNLETIGWRSQNKSNIVALLTGFFEFYSEFNYNDLFIYPVEAIALKREWLDKCQNLPVELADHISDIPGDQFSVVPMCIMDPFDFSHNLTKRIQSYLFNALIECMRLSATLLKSSTT